MSLFNLHVELQWIAPLLERLVTAVERIAGPLPVASPTPARMSTLSDYAYISASEQERMKVEQDLFATSNMLMPGSEAYIRAVTAFEQQIMDSYGPETGKQLVSQLPWKVQAPSDGA